MKMMAMMMLLASSAMLTMAQTTPAPTTGGATTAGTAGAPLCTKKIADDAWDVVEDAAKPSEDKCALDAGITDEDVLANMVGVTPAQLDLIVKSANCAAYYTFVQKALASIQPPCAISKTPKEVTTADMAAFTLQQYAAYFKDSSSASANSTTVAPGAATTKPTLSTGSSAGTTTKAPTPKPTSSATGVTAGLLTVAVVAAGAM